MRVNVEELRLDRLLGRCHVFCALHAHCALSCTMFAFQRDEFIILEGSHLQPPLILKQGRTRAFGCASHAAWRACVDWIQVHVVNAWQVFTRHCHERAACDNMALP